MKIPQEGTMSKANTLSFIKTNIVSFSTRFIFLCLNTRRNIFFKNMLNTRIIPAQQIQTYQLILLRKYAYCVERQRKQPILYEPFPPPKSTDLNLSS